MQNNKKRLQARYRKVKTEVTEIEGRVRQLYAEISVTYSNLPICRTKEDAKAKINEMRGQLAEMEDLLSNAFDYNEELKGMAATIQNINAKRYN